ncbi:hypothetical protein GCM10027033_09530 [Leucobacter ruminantium]
MQGAAIDLTADASVGAARHNEVATVSQSCPQLGDGGLTTHASTVEQNSTSRISPLTQNRGFVEKWFEISPVDGR